MISWDLPGLRTGCGSAQALNPERQCSRVQPVTPDSSPEDPDGCWDWRGYRTRRQRGEAEWTHTRVGDCHGQPGDRCNGGALQEAEDRLMWPEQRAQGSQARERQGGDKERLPEARGRAEEQSLGHCSGLDGVHVSGSESPLLP